MNIRKIVERLQKDEGFSEKSFWDFKQWTWGYGTKAPGEGHKITEDAARKELIAHVCESINDYYDIFGWNPICPINEVRERALVNMIYNLGADGVRKFVKMRRAIAAGDWDRAANEAQDSKWFSQVGRRAERICFELRTGKEWG